jgi:hypothetical protein
MRCFLVSRVRLQWMFFWFKRTALRVLCQEYHADVWYVSTLLVPILCHDQLRLPVGVRLTRFTSAGGCTLWKCALGCLATTNFQDGPRVAANQWLSRVLDAAWMRPPIARGI